MDNKKHNQHPVIKNIERSMKLSWAMLKALYDPDHVQPGREKQHQDVTKLIRRIDDGADEEVGRELITLLKQDRLTREEQEAFGTLQLLFESTTTKSLQNLGKHEGRSPRR